jgi:hypothetical protein
MTKSRRKATVPAALHVGVMAQLGALDPLRVRLVADDPEVREALATLAAARPLGPSAVEAMARDILTPAILRAERRRVLRGEAARAFDLAPGLRPDVAAMAAATGLPLDLSTRVALENVLRRRPAARDAKLWQHTAAGAVGYLVRAARLERQRGEAKRDLEPAAKTEAFFQETGEPTRGARRALAALDAREADRRVATRVLDDLAAGADLTPTMRGTLTAILAGTEVTRSRRQDLVGRLRRVAGQEK